jgi:MFS family permease
MFIANGVSFVAILLGILTMNTAELRPSPPAPRGGRPVRDALAFVRHDRTLLVVFLVFTVVSTFSFNYSVVLPKLADQRWGSESAFGWILAVTSVGSLLGSLLTAGRPVVTVRWFGAGVALLGISNIALAWAPNLALAYVAAVPLGAGGAALVASTNSITQVASPPDMRGRLLALVAVAFLGSTPIGGPVTGFVADHVSIEWSLGYGGIVALVSCLWLFRVDQRAQSRTGNVHHAHSSA